MNIARIFAAVTLFAWCLPAPAFAWGAKGHTIISRLAARDLAGVLPAFVTSSDGAYEIAYLGPEMDRIKGAGQSWDGDYDPGHYVDFRDDGTIAGVVSAASMPADREAYDTALRGVQTDQYRQGYLPYEILDGWEELREDFAYWRVDDYAAAHDATPVQRSEAARDRAIMQRVVLQDLGVWSHFVGDGSQPLHVSVHFNGWGNFPNPENFTQSHETHSAFESEFVNRYVSESQVAQLVKNSTMPAPTALSPQSDVMAAIVKYLEDSRAAVPQLYRIEKRGGFAGGSPDAVAFAAGRLAAGVMALRDLTVWAWQDSAFASVGYPEVRVPDVLSGRAAWPPHAGD